MVVPTQDRVEGEGGRELPILAERQMRHRHLEGQRPQRGQGGAARRERIVEAQAGAGIRRPHRLRGGESDDADTHPVEVPRAPGPRAAEGQAARAIEHVGGQPRESRLAHPLGQHRGPEIELVVAEGGEVEPHRIPALDHLGPLAQGREQRRRERVTGQREERVRGLGAQLARQRRHAGEPAAAGHRLEHVDVVDEQELDAHRGAIRAARLRAARADDQPQEGQREEAGGRVQGASGGTGSRGR